MWVFRLKGDFQSLDPVIPELFARGARGLEERDGEVLAYFGERVPLPLPGRWEEQTDEDWLTAWKRELTPVEAGRFVIRAPWHPPAKGPEEVVIEPGMAFGTGHHETTRLALLALSEAVRPGMRVLDLGTGSGVLAIAAAKLGARVLAVDTDPVAVAAARKNAKQNRVAIEVREGSLEAAPGPFDLIVANLYAELHIQLTTGYRERMVPGGTALLTGILSAKAAAVEAAARAAGLAKTQETREGEWSLLAFTKG